MAMKLSPRRTVYLVGDPAAGAAGFAAVAGPAGAFVVETAPERDVALEALAVVAGLGLAVVGAFVFAAVAVAVAAAVVGGAVLPPPVGITRRRPATIRWGLASPFALARAVAPTR